MSETKIPTWRAVIQYWGYNMDVVHRLKLEWPGFGYTDEEKEQLAALSAGLSGWKYAAFLVLNAAYFNALAIFVVFVGVLPIATLLDPQHQNGLIFLGCIAAAAVVCLGFGIPATMGLTALTLNWLLGPSDPGAVSEEQAAALYRKMTRQFTRVGIILGVLLVPLVVFGRTQIGEKVMALLQRAIVVLTPFAILVTTLRVLAPAAKKK